MKRITVNLPDELYQALAEYQSCEGLPSISQALVTLTATALKVESAPVAWGDPLRFRLAEIHISVANCRAVVSNATGAASNWEELEEDAMAEIEGQGGHQTMSAIYPCSSRLAVRARFAK